jgi:hypothetical protein
MVSAVFESSCVLEVATLTLAEDPFLTGLIHGSLVPHYKGVVAIKLWVNTRKLRVIARKLGIIVMKLCVIVR